MISPHRLALASLLSALVTVLSFCIGVAPIPLTALVCYPAAALGAIITMLTGWLALRQIRPGGGGRWMALTGLWVGGLTLLVVACFATLALTIAPALWDWAARAWQSVSP